MEKTEPPVPLPPKLKAVLMIRNQFRQTQTRAFLVIFSQDPFPDDFNPHLVLKNAVPKGITHLPPFASNASTDADSDYALWNQEGKQDFAGPSPKHVKIYHQVDDKDWMEFATFPIKRRVMKVMITPRLDYFLIVDKCGDVYASRMDTSETVAQFKRIMGHCSLILECAVDQTNPEGPHYIFTTDQDHKIRCSRFPDAHNIEYYLLLHESPVTNFQLSKDGTKAISLGKDRIGFKWCLKNREMLEKYKISEKATFQVLISRHMN